jgi:hypothetical protein
MRNGPVGPSDLQIWADLRREVNPERRRLRRVPALEAISLRFV